MRMFGAKTRPAPGSYVAVVEFRLFATDEVLPRISTMMSGKTAVSPSISVLHVKPIERFSQYSATRQEMVPRVGIKAVILFRINTLH